MLALQHVRLFSPLVMLLLAACSNGTGSVDERQNAPPVQAAQGTFSIGGSVSGLAGSGLVLQNNGGNDLTIAADGAFNFSNQLAGGASYNVTVRTQPTGPAQACSVTNGNGTVANANVSGISIACVTGQFSVGGSVSGLAGSGLVLQNNGVEDLAISAPGNFVFPSRLVNGGTYSVSVRSQPAGQNCVVRNPSGTIAGASVSNVAISCASNQFAIGGAVTGLSGTGLVLRLNGGNDLAIVGNGPYAFETGVASGTPYVVSVRTQPSNPAQVCSLANHQGTVAAANVTNVAVSCSTSSHTVGGAVTGLIGSGLVLTLNGANDLSIAGNGAFTFPARLPSGSQYVVAVRTQPSNPAQLCTLANRTSTIGTADVTNVQVSCAANTFAVGVNVSGLMGTGLVLQNNGSDLLSISSNGTFTFPGELANGAAYDVRIRTQPSNPAQSCSISNGSGTIAGADIISIAVNCTSGEHTIGGSVSGLSGTGLMLRNNGADDLVVSASGSFVFAIPLPTGATYNVSVARQPVNPTQVCTVRDGSGTVGMSNVTGVSVQCVTTVSGFLVGGHVKDLRGEGLVLQNNGGDDLAIASNGSFNFPTRLTLGAFYNVTVANQPRDPDQRCRVENGVGIIINANIQNVEIKCRRDRDDDDDD